MLPRGMHSTTSEELSPQPAGNSPGAQKVPVGHFEVARRDYRRELAFQGTRLCDERYEVLQAKVCNRESQHDCDNQNQYSLMEL